ncbi:hypothetical protein HG264_02210 [Pseudomonas sp. gcc21]|uniref:hypothetical protein n=1 Tax=Pseudomonas sp. gcc21 TaxID=2726989 RepID=UPI001451E5AE|nr:hypothetical protein [Pseudomonas sp. gcc21]QJD57807.1 hypothetical protein HG264_02210 [Pseudomonas sp. gcc21]
MKIFRTLGFCFLFIMVPLGGLLAAYPNEVANAVSSIFGTPVSRGALGIAFLFIAAVCMRIDMSIRRRHAEM